MHSRERVGRSCQVVPQLTEHTVVAASGQSFGEPLLPQHCTVPSVATAQARWVPSTTALLAGIADTAAGTTRFVVSPMPSCPLALSPQQRHPAEVFAQVLLPPATTVVAPVRPATATGQRATTVLPWPS